MELDYPGLFFVLIGISGFLWADVGTAGELYDIFSPPSTKNKTVLKPLFFVFSGIGKNWIESGHKTALTAC